MTLIDGVGYLASALVLLTFCMSTMLSLRAVAIGSNLAFVAYGLSADVYPVLALHLILLPLNVVILVRMALLLRKAKLAAATDLSPAWLQPFMREKRFKAGETVFRKGDFADSLYMIVSGEVRLPEIDARLSPGELLGEIGLFSDRAAAHTDRCRHNGRGFTLDQRSGTEKALRTQPGPVAVFPATDSHANNGQRRPRGAYSAGNACWGNGPRRRECGCRIGGRLGAFPVGQFV